MNTEGLDIQALDTLLYVCSFVIGAMVGSFLNVCVYRIPAGLSIVKPRSRCPKCEQMIAWYDNIPMVSWLLLGAKCRNCKAPISWQYPLVEAITAFLFLAVYWQYELTLATPVYMLLAAALVLVTFVDLTDWTIPNEVTFPGMPLGIAFSLVAMFYPDSGLVVLGRFEPVFNALLGLFAGGGVLYALDKATLILLKKRGMGFGDVKLLAMLGAFFGYPGVVLIIMIASLIGSIIGIAFIVANRSKSEEHGGHYLPFGPYLALGGLVVMLFGQGIYDWYMAYLGLTPAL
ncbi:MAG: prepilin peptidase [Candidatus Hydrogenedentes bacterium]|nr:prepilin peptidase [Candidatus Hydrogenedentota bacterium]